ncbi:MAG: thioredoxin domain-containing protein [Pirellulales bacterium]
MRFFKVISIAATIATLLAPRGDLVRGDEPGAAADAKPTTARHTNRLAKETSPYLLLHAHNPVDWYPWGDEALARAKKEKKLIFLSVGYSSCYWCHVMERESFMDDDIAAKLNENFVCIKVDREERPDIDEIYMQALNIYLQLVGSKQGGGWPLSMFLTPDAKPLMGGTYFPPRDREGMLGFSTVLDRVLEAWNSDPEKWQKTGDSLADYVSESLRQRPILRVVKLEKALVDSVLRSVAARFDSDHGGFGFDPANPRMAKFPEPPNLMFLLDYSRRADSEPARKMLSITLQKILQGGIRDHVGGGFHRYSTDRFWRVPHFEKMLYDNAQLVTVYALAYEFEPRAYYRRAVDETIEFVFREMTDQTGAFYSALDAETNAEEGRYYVWQREEVGDALSPEEYALWADVYGIAGEPNFEERYIPLLAAPLADLAKSRKLTEDELNQKLQPIRQKLLARRAKRPHPLTDTKILTGWNGLMIRGLAEAGRVFKNDESIAAAAKAADFILVNLRDGNRRLLRTYAAGQAKIPAYLDDYAFLIDGLIALHKATGDDRWLKAAGALTETQLELFWDERIGGFFFTSTQHEKLIARSKLLTDTVTPSGNSVSAANLLYLADALEKPQYVSRAEACIRSAAPILDEHPSAVPQLAVALGQWIEMSSRGDAKTANEK